MRTRNAAQSKFFVKIFDHMSHFTERICAIGANGADSDEFIYGQETHLTSETKAAKIKI